MIITVTFNPSIDKTGEVEALRIGELNRLHNIILQAGGKGINVSKTIHALGGDSICSGFLAGSTGESLQGMLNTLSISCDFVWVDGMTRTNLKVLSQDMELTEINEAGPHIYKKDIDKLKKKVLSLTTPGTMVVLSGNVPIGVPSSIYKDMIIEIKQAGGSVIMDADGELFAQGIQAKPTIMKPNKYELTTYFDVSQDIKNEELICLAETLLNDDTKMVVVSMGEEGSIFIQKDIVYQADALSIQAHSSVGAGDAMVASIAYAMEQGYDLKNLICLAVACSAGAVITKGTQPAKKEVVEALMKRVTIRQVK